MRMRRFWSIGLLILLFSLAGSAGQKRPANVIIISVDTLRADHLSCYGYERRTSPAIDALVSRGALFMDAITQVPLTTPSFCSMMTSRYPHQTGSIRNGVPMIPQNQTLPGILKSSGYTTAAILSNWPLKSHLSGLGQNFDLYDDDFHKKRWVVVNDERDAEDVTDRTLEWLDGSPAEPFFLWVHYSDPHSPYLLHKEFNYRDKGEVSQDRLRVDDYDSEISYADHHIGRLLARLEALSLPERSLIVFMADHGESLGDHDYFGHGRKVYQSSLHVPLALIGPGIGQGRRIAGDAQLLDVAPTILDYLKIPQGKDMLGASLMASAAGGEPLPERTLYFETYPGAMPVEEVRELAELARPIWIGFKSGEHKVMYSHRFFTWESYDLKTDPGETNNLAKVTDQKFIADSDKLMAWYNSWTAGGTAVGATNAISEDDRKKLQSLGYIDK